MREKPTEVESIREGMVTILLIVLEVWKWDEIVCIGPFLSKR